MEDNYVTINSLDPHNLLQPLIDDIDSCINSLHELQVDQDNLDQVVDIIKYDAIHSKLLSMSFKIGGEVIKEEIEKINWLVENAQQDAKSCKVIEKYLNDIQKIASSRLNYLEGKFQNSVPSPQVTVLSKNMNKMFREGNGEYKVKIAEYKLNIVELKGNSDGEIEGDQSTFESDSENYSDESTEYSSSSERSCN